MRAGWIGAVTVALFMAACATAPREMSGPPVWPSLMRFSNEAEFRAYVDAARDAPRPPGGLASQVKADPVDPNCPPELFPCEDEDNDNIVVTAARRSEAGPTSITNVQNAGVDEGDIVKLYGRFLIVLQDGRLFSVDTGETSAELALVDRINVYRNPGADAWYDEVLIHGNRVVVTGYNYGQDATEFSVFSISEAGRFTREATYFLSSDDYYDTENYATRLVNGNLVIYTPLSTEALHDDRIKWPIVRRWLSEGEHQAVTSRGRALFDAHDIYRPIQQTTDPYVHTISVCPLGGPRAGDELDCRSTAVVAPPGREFYVSDHDVYLWTITGSDDYDYDYDAPCDRGNPAEFRNAAPGALFQVPLAGGPPRAQFVRGIPYDQMSMESDAHEFRALTVWLNGRCPLEDKEALPLRYVHTPRSAFSARPEAVPELQYTQLPSVGAAIENRFTDHYLVYGGRITWRSGAPDAALEAPQTSRVVAVPIAAPEAPVVLTAPHGVIRVERVGDNAVLTGYHDGRGLNVSMLDLAAAPHIATTVLLPDRYETEGRSHAFNSVVQGDGGGVFGLPTAIRAIDSERYWWRSESSDVSFLSFTADGQLASLGALTSAAEPDETYECEVSCIDWYGNSRALFIGNRVFALSGTELVEGARRGAGIGEVARVNLTASPRAPYGLTGALK